MKRGCPAGLREKRGRETRKRENGSRKEKELVRPAESEKQKKFVKKRCLAGLRGKRDRETREVSEGGRKDAENIDCVDMQNDFIDGALGTPEAVAIVPRWSRKSASFREK